MVNFEKNKDKILTNCTVLNLFVGGACPRTPLVMRMLWPYAACRFATCKFQNIKKILGPLLKYWERPCSYN